MTEKEISTHLTTVTTDSQYFGYEGQFGVMSALIALVKNLYQERGDPQDSKGEEKDPTVSAGAVVPNKPGLYEVVCTAGVSSLQIGDVVRLHSLVGGFDTIYHFFVRQNDYSTHRIQVHKDSSCVRLRKIEQSRTKTV